VLLEDEVLSDDEYPEVMYDEPICDRFLSVGDS
jgi:hypothetical protein